MTFSQILHAVRKRWVLIVLITSTGSGCSALYTSKLTPVYSASASIEIHSPALNDVQVLSNPFIEQIDALILDRIRIVDREVTSSIADKQNAIHRYSVSVRLDEDSQGLNVSCSHSDPEFAMKLCNAYANAAVHYAEKKRPALIESWDSFLVARIQTAPKHTAELEIALDKLHEFEAIPPVRYEVVQEARTPAMQIYPNRKTNMLVAFSISLMLALWVAILAESAALEKEAENASVPPAVD